MKKSKAGGYRAGAGRPIGTGRYKEPTRPIRIPVRICSQIEKLLCSHPDLDSLEEGIENLLLNRKKQPHLSLVPLYTDKIAAGSPTTAEDHVDMHVDLNQYLIQRPSSVFLVKAKGDSMINAGIYENTILIVDRSVEPTNGKIVIAMMNGELTVKRLKRDKKGLFLIPENTHYSPIEITPEMEFTILGVVIHAIQSF